MKWCKSVFWYLVLFLEKVGNGPLEIIWACISRSPEKQTISERLCWPWLIRHLCHCTLYIFPQCFQTWHLQQQINISVICILVKLNASNFLYCQVYFMMIDQIVGKNYNYLSRFHYFIRRNTNFVSWLLFGCDKHMLNNWHPFRANIIPQQVFPTLHLVIIVNWSLNCD